jgi:hypothetical protein
VLDFNPWVKSVIDGIAAEFAASAQEYPHVPTDAEDPYTPPWGGSAVRR